MPSPKTFPDLPWPWITAFALTLLLGGLGLWQMNSLVETEKAELSTALQQQQQMLRRRFTPNLENIELLEKKNKLLFDTQQSFQQQLTAGVDQLKVIREINAINFKLQLAEKVRSLTEEAKKRNIILPNNFYYGYSLYNSEINPPDRATVLLQKQLLAIEALSQALYESGVEAIHSIRRAPDPAEPIPTTGARGGSSTHPDYLPISVSLSTSGHYLNIPLEIEFSCRTDGLRKFLNSIHQAKFVFIPRYLEIKGSRTTIPRLSDFQNQNSSEEIDRSVPILAMGDESIRVTTRIDLVEWTSSPNDEHLSVKKDLQQQPQK
jgi:hypothetical protein